MDNEPLRSGVRLPFLLKVMGVFVIVGSLAEAGLRPGPFEILWAVGGTVIGVGLLVRKRWAWYLTIGFTLLNLVAGLVVFLFFWAFLRGWLSTLDLVFRTTVLVFVALGYSYNGFVLYYLSRFRIRSLFGIGTASRR